VPVDLRAVYINGYSHLTALGGEVQLTIFHLVALMLVVGIGIDYSLFFSRQEASTEDSRRTFHALAVCALSTSSVFAILASSAIPVLNAIGLTTAIGVIVSFLAAMVLSSQPKQRSKKKLDATSMSIN
jgi:predicted exporter